MTMPRKRLGESGMTLVEMGVVLATIAVLAALGIPSLVKMVPRVKLNSSAMILSNDIAVARMRAIAKSSDFRITFDPAADSYKTEKKVGANWVSLGVTIINGVDLVKVQGLAVRPPDAPQVSSPPPESHTLLLYMNGGANVTLGAQAFIELQRKPKPDDPPGTVTELGKRITIEPTGRMYLERRASVGGAWVAD